MRIRVHIPASALVVQPQVVSIRVLKRLITHRLSSSIEKEFCPPILPTHSHLSSIPSRSSSGSQCVPTLPIFTLPDPDLSMSSGASSSGVFTNYTTDKGLSSTTAQDAQRQQQLHTVTIAISAVISAVVVILVVGFFLWRLRRNRRIKKIEEEMEEKHLSTDEDQSNENQDSVTAPYLPSIPIPSPLFISSDPSSVSGSADGSHTTRVSEKELCDLIQNAPPDGGGTNSSIPEPTAPPEHEYRGNSNTTLVCSSAGPSTDLYTQDIPAQLGVSIPIDTKFEISETRGELDVPQEWSLVDHKNAALFSVVASEPPPSQDHEGSSTRSRTIPLASAPPAYYR